jgi:hypothetical protein
MGQDLARYALPAGLVKPVVVLVARRHAHLLTHGELRVGGCTQGNQSGLRFTTT